MSEHSYTIGELARLAGVTPRTIRYYVAEGLLPPPRSAGATARYDDDHLRRLELIRRLQRDETMPLAKIRASLEALDERAVRELLAGVAASAPPQALQEARTAQEYLRALLRPEGSPPRLRDALQQRAQALTPPGPLGATAPAELPPWPAEPPDRLRAHRAEAQTPRAAGGSWQRYVWHPDIEVQVRQLPEDPRLRKRLAGLLQALRATIESYVSDQQEVHHDRDNTERV